MNPQLHSTPKKSTSTDTRVSPPAGKPGWLGHMFEVAFRRSVCATVLRKSLSSLAGELESPFSRQRKNGQGEEADRVPVQAAPFGIEFVDVAAGEFMMGSLDGGCDEQPRHSVTISRPFQMSRFLVTQGQWKSLMGANPSFFNLGDHLPVESVSWHDAQQFAARLSAECRDGYSYRLPTEAEWEYACRAGSTGDFAGNLQDMAWYGVNSGGRTHPVGQKMPNALGLYDMHGNLWEWVQDWYSSTYYLKSPATDPTGPGPGNYRVIRGGAWIVAANSCRSSHRDARWPGSRSYHVGFRLIRSNS